MQCCGRVCSTILMSPNGTLCVSFSVAYGCARAGLGAREVMAAMPMAATAIACCLNVRPLILGAHRPPPVLIIRRHAPWYVLATSAAMVKKNGSRMDGDSVPRGTELMNHRPQCSAGPPLLARRTKILTF